MADTRESSFDFDDAAVELLMNDGEDWSGARRVNRSSTEVSTDSFGFPVFQDKRKSKAWRSWLWTKLSRRRRLNTFWTRVIISIGILCVICFLVWLTGVFTWETENSTPPVEDKNGCPGYEASNIKSSHNELTADLTLSGPPCNTYGDDLKYLRLKVEYQTNSRILVKIYDEAEEVYQVPETVFPRPVSSESDTTKECDIDFSFEESPFSFRITRKSSSEVLFDTSVSALVFQSQYLRLRTRLPPDANLYGMGEHSDSFRLARKDYTRTIWNRDSFDVPAGTNLYGAHPIYFDHRGDNGTHGIFLLNSNGMDVKISDDETPHLEYNILGGVFELYFFAGPSPTDVSRQYAEVAGLPASIPYWGLGLHNCRYGYKDWYDLAEVVHNYSKAGISLETMWTDIDYMDRRKVFSLDEKRFPKDKMKEFVSTLHDRQQHYVVMVDPAVGYHDYPAFRAGVESDIFLKQEDGTIFQGVVWPGPSVFPDWFHPNTTPYWIQEFEKFFNVETGIDIDALWIDMNEPSNFCPYPCPSPKEYARRNHIPPDPHPLRPVPLRPLPGWPSDFQPAASREALTEDHEDSGAPPVYPKKKQVFDKPKPGDMKGLPGRDLLNPNYRIRNEGGVLSHKTVNTDIRHANDLKMYDTHNMYGSMMSSASRAAMLSRRPSLKPMIITRSTFAGAGAHVGHWLGDNLSKWDHYLISIPQMLQFASLYQIPVVGSDICGFIGVTTEKLCARWAMLGAFNPFYRNHNDLGEQAQEFYRWDLVTSAAKKAIEIRYMMLDYIYTALQHQHVDGTPILNPLFFLYPYDRRTFDVQTQFFYGDALLVSPVVEESSTSVTFYLPDDMFYDYYTGSAVRGNGSNIIHDEVPYDHIPLHVRGGTIIPLRASSANTTTELRKKNFNILIALGLDGSANGSLYLDDGVSLTPTDSSNITFEYKRGVLAMDGSFEYETAARIEKVTIWGLAGKPKAARSGRENHVWSWRENNSTLVVDVDVELKGTWRMKIQ